MKRAQDQVCKHNWITPPECPQCVAEERDRYEKALQLIGYLPDGTPDTSYLGTTAREALKKAK